MESELMVNQIFPLVYDELRALARGVLRRRGGDDNLGATGLVHETYVRIANRTRQSVHDRGHFFALASKAMRQILVDHSRARAALKRGSATPPSALEEGDLSSDVRHGNPRAAEDRAAETLAVDEALLKLEALDPRLVEIVDMRFFDGLTVEETAAALNVSARTVKREWQRARAFLLAELSRLRPAVPGSPS